MKRIVFDATQTKEIIKGYCDGKSLRILADFNGVDVKTISKLLRNNGVQIRDSHAHCRKPLDKIVADWNAMMPTEKIVHKYGFSSIATFHIWKHEHKGVGFVKRYVTT